MDKEGLGTVASFNVIAAEHFTDGYFSPTVRAAAEELYKKSEAERQAAFIDLFEDVFAKAEAVQAHERFTGTLGNESDGEIDLTEQGLSVINIRTSTFDNEEAANEGGSPYRAVLVQPEMSYLGSDDLQQYEPRDWQDAVHANLDGSHQPHDFVKGYRGTLNRELLRLLEMQETLDVVIEALAAPQQRAPRGLGHTAADYEVEQD